MNVLQQLFPTIRTREQILSEIHSNPGLSAVYERWEEDQQMRFLDFCSGEKGIRILTDGFIKEIFNPEYDPGRLEDFLSLVMRQDIHIKTILPNDSTRLTSESYLIITDMVIELEDGSLANIEIQRLGYMFTGQRSACYSADLLLRQYKRVRNRERKKFSYKQIKNVYIIVLYEKSPSEFKSFPNDYIHYLEASSDTGIKIDLLQKYIYIPLDIFQKSLQNNGIRNRLEAWLAFLSSDDPQIILKLIQAYPYFQTFYREIYALCQNTEKVMNMFSEELAILDRNTEQYMMDEMQAEIDRMSAERDKIKAQNDQIKAQNDQIKAQNDQMKAQNDQMKAELAERDRLIAELRRELATQS